MKQGCTSRTGSHDRGDGAHYLPPWMVPGFKKHGPSIEYAVRIAETWIGSDRETSFVRREDFLKVGGFNEELVAAEDEIYAID